MTVAHHPLHRSGRAALPHPALALGEDAKAHQRVRMTHCRGRKPPSDEPGHAVPREAGALTAPPQHAMPQTSDRPAEGAERRGVQGHAVVAHMPPDDRAQVGADLRYGIVQTMPQLGLHLAQFRLPPSAHRLAPDRKPPLPRLRAEVREAEEVEGRRFPVSARPPGPVGVPTKLDEARFVGMQHQSESREPLAQCGEEAFGLLPMLESDDEVVREAHHDHIAACLGSTPSLDPEVEDVVQIDVGQQRTDDAPYAKGNFQFERVIPGWRERPALDLRRK